MKDFPRSESKEVDRSISFNVGMNKHIHHRVILSTHLCKLKFHLLSGYHHNHLVSWCLHYANLISSYHQNFQSKNCLQINSEWFETCKSIKPAMPDFLRLPATGLEISFAGSHKIKGGNKSNLVEISPCISSHIIPPPIWNVTWSTVPYQNFYYF